jgi:hypothetical protein
MRKNREAAAAKQAAAGGAAPAAASPSAAASVVKSSPAAAASSAPSGGDVDSRSDPPFLTRIFPHHNLLPVPPTDWLQLRRSWIELFDTSIANLSATNWTIPPLTLLPSPLPPLPQSLATPYSL